MAPNLMSLLRFFREPASETSEALETTIDFGYVMHSHLGRVNNRAEVIRQIEEAIRDGEITLSDWMKIGKMLGLRRK